MILNEFFLNTGYHRKYAIRLLNGPPPARGPRRRRRPHRFTYGPQVLSILTAVWEAAGYPWSVRLKVLLPLELPWVRRRFRLPEEIERHLLRISPRQIDRRLQGKKRQLHRRTYGRTRPGRLLQHQAAVQTHHWDVKIPASPRWTWWLIPATPEIFNTRNAAAPYRCIRPFPNCSASGFKAQPAAGRIVGHPEIIPKRGSRK